MGGVTSPLALFQNLGMGEIILILAVLLLLFGSTKLPKLARSLGSSFTEFKKGLRGDAAASDDDASKKLSDAEQVEEKPKARPPSP
jgi:sec-independent protein translocase protein TatA